MADRRRGVRDRLGGVRARTTVVASVVVATALLLGATVMLVLLHRSLVAAVDSTARSRAQDVAALVRHGDLPRTLAVPGQEDALVQVVDRTGRVVAASANLEGEDRITEFRPGRARLQSRTLAGLPIGNNGKFRVVALDADGPGGTVTVYVAVSLEQVAASVAAVRDILFVGLPLLLTVVGATTWVIVGKALQPVESIRAEVAEITAHDLSRRVPEPVISDEIGRLARTMNAMLERLERFSERQRRFVADASHELQSPLASSRSELEVALAHPDRTDWTATARRLMDDNVRMEHLVRDLLFLARADDPASTVVHGPVDLDDVVRDEVRRARVHARVPIDASRVAPVEVNGNADQLGRVVRNLLENAERHALSSVTVEVSHEAGWARVIVCDDGPGIPPKDRERVFERFTRLDSSRNRNTGGAGLGLAIAREIVQAHRGHIFIADTTDSGARFVVEIPMA